MPPRPRKSDVWTAEVELTLIEYMKQRPYMWDCNHRDFHQIELKRRAFQECAALLGSQITGEMVRDRWTNMRTTFASNYKRTQQKNGSEEEVGSPSWSLYNSLIFLEPTVAARRSMSNQQFVMVPSEGTIECKMEEEEAPLCRIAETKGTAAITSPNTEYSKYDFEFTPKSLRYSRKYSSEDAFVDHGDMESSSRERVVAETHSREALVAKEEDEWDDFGKMVSKILRKMPEMEAREVQVEFFKILFSRSQRNS